MRDLGVVSFVPNLGTFHLSDDFTCGGVAATAIPNWTETNSASGTNTKQAGGVNHSGVLRLTTGAASGNNKRLHLGNTASDPSFSPANFDRFIWIVRIPTITTVTVRLGLMQDISAASGGTAGAYFQFDPAVSAGWQTVTRQASASTANTSINVVAGSWYALEARRLDSGNWEFWINGVLRFTHSATPPTTDCAFGVFVATGAAAARNVDLDYCFARGNLGQMWT